MKTIYSVDKTRFNTSTGKVQFNLCVSCDTIEEAKKYFNYWRKVDPDCVIELDQLHPYKMIDYYEPNL